MSDPKRQHYFPQSLQQNFLAAGESKLWVYDRIENKYRQATPNQIAVQSHLYSLKNPESTNQRYEVENALSKLESKAVPALSKLRQRAKLGQSEWNAVSEYVGMQYMRTPDQLRVIADLSIRTGEIMVETLAADYASMTPDEFAQAMRTASSRIGHDYSSLDQESFRKLAEKNTLKVTPPYDVDLALMADAGTDLGVTFSGRQWIVLHAPNGSNFIGSDCPVIQHRNAAVPEGYILGPLTPGAVNILPIASDAALAITVKEGGRILHSECTSEQVHYINVRLADLSDRIIFASSRPNLETLAMERKLGDWRPKVSYIDDALRKVARDAYGKSKQN